MPTRRCERVAEGDPLQARREVPEQPLVEPAAVVEGIGDQLPGARDDLGWRRQCRAGFAAEHFPDQQHQREDHQRRNDMRREIAETRAIRCARGGRFGASGTTVAIVGVTASDGLRF